MTAAPTTRQGLVQKWVAQLVTALVLCGVVLMVVRNSSFQLGTYPEEWKRYMVYALLVACIPALLYVRRYKAILMQDLRLERERGGTPEPTARQLLSRALALGGALCDLPMALGVLQLLMGGETKWFLGGTMLAIALRLSYRPFIKAA
jgi:hypothetical protein